MNYNLITHHSDSLKCHKYNRTDYLALSVLSKHIQM